MKIGATYVNETAIALPVKKCDYGVVAIIADIDIDAAFYLIPYSRVKEWEWAIDNDYQICESPQERQEIERTIKERRYYTPYQERTLTFNPTK